jgi:hypothetical protein
MLDENTTRIRIASIIAHHEKWTGYTPVIQVDEDKFTLRVICDGVVLAGCEPRDFVTSFDYTGSTLLEAANASLEGYELEATLAEPDRFGSPMSSLVNNETRESVFVNGIEYDVRSLAEATLKSEPETVRIEDLRFTPHHSVSLRIIVGPDNQVYDGNKRLTRWSRDRHVVTVYRVTNEDLARAALSPPTMKSIPRCADCGGDDHATVPGERHPDDPKWFTCHNKDGFHKCGWWAARCLPHPVS